MTYIPTTKLEQEAMKKSLAISDVKELFHDIPDEVKLKELLKLPKGKSEFEVVKEIQNLANQNNIYSIIFRGGGSYHHLIPEVVKSLSSLSGFVTSYTPYQPEISQGNLQAMFEYQTEICNLLDMDVTNSSIYDGGSAAGEAMIMTLKKQANTYLVADTINPHTLKVLKTYAFAKDVKLIMVNSLDGKIDLVDLKQKLTSDVVGFYLENPNYFGIIEDIQQASTIIHQTKAKLVLGVNPIASAILKTPGEVKADIACGEGQSLGMEMAFGGPYLGFLATTKKLMRKLPGRIVGQTLDNKQQTAYVLTIQAREQHIRREMASSSICSNQALCALTAAFYMGALGQKGIVEVANQCLTNAHYGQQKICEINGYSLLYQQEFFNEFVIKTPVSTQKINQACKNAGILGPLPLDEKTMLVCMTEANCKAEIDQLVTILKEVAQ